LRTLAQVNHPHTVVGERALQFVDFVGLADPNVSAALLTKENGVEANKLNPRGGFLAINRRHH